MKHEVWEDLERVLDVAAAHNEKLKDETLFEAIQRLRGYMAFYQKDEV